MENKKPHNPQAFPQEWIQNGSTDNWENGMTLRDYFAAKAMQGITSNSNYGIFDGTHNVHIPTIEKCYNIADAMLKQRELFTNIK